MDEDLIAKRFEIALPFLDERRRRLFLATEAMAIGHGGISIVSNKTGVARATIASGCRELADFEVIESSRTRRRGGGRTKVSNKDPLLRESLQALLEPSEGDSKGYDLLWTTMSLRTLCSELSQMGQPVSRSLLARLLQEMGWSYHRQSKADGEGPSLRDQSTQFQKIASTVQAFQKCGQPVIFLEMKRLEQGETGDPGIFTENIREFTERDQSKRFISGVKRQRDNGAQESGNRNRRRWGDPAANRGMVLSGVNLVSQWWQVCGHELFRGAEQLLIVTNGVDGWNSRIGMWKEILEGAVKSLELIPALYLLPSGMSKWRNVACQVSTTTTWNMPGHLPSIHKIALCLIGGLSLEDRSYVCRWSDEDCPHEAEHRLGGTECCCAPGVDGSTDATR